MTFGSLFSGIGGFDLGLERAGMRCEWQVEIDPYCQRVLAKHWPNVRRWDDVKTFPPKEGDWKVDLICGGFPCQDISSSGNKVGIDGPLSGLWKQFHRIICTLRPRFAFMENVSDLLYRGLGDVLADLAEGGYDAEWHSIPASFFGLPQARERVWIVAYPCVGRRKRIAQRNIVGPIIECRNDDDRLAVGQRRARDARSWVSRADDGIPNRLDRVGSCGNAVVPQVAEWIGRRIMEAAA